MGQPAPEPAVLLVVHSLPPLEYSGTPAIAHAYARHLAGRGVRVAVLYGTARPDAPPLRGYADAEHGFLRYEVPTTPRLWHLWGIHDAAAAHPPRVDALHAVLDEFRPKLVHILDLVNLPGEWAEAVKARGVPVLRQVWNAEDLCGLIEPMFPAPPATTCPAPVTPRQCAECCFRRLVAVTLPADTYPAHRLLERLTALRERSVAEFERLLGLKRRQAEDAFRRHYDRIVFPTRSFRAFFERTLPLPPERTAVVEPGVDLAVDRSATPPAPEGRVRFLFLGNLLAKKGVDELIAVFTHPDLLGRADYDLTVCGGGNPTALQKACAANPRVRHLGGYTPDRLPALLRAADVGLSPSRFETFHRVTREYLAAGLPVIGSTAFGIPEAVRDGVNGLLFAPGDAAGFRAAVLRVLEDRDLLARLTLSARQFVARTTADEIADLTRQYAATVAASASRAPRPEV